MRPPPTIARLAAEDHLAPMGSALDLAVFRITIAALIASSSSAAVATHWATLPVAARTAPLGVGWLLPHLPITPGSISLARAVLLVASFTAAAGWFTRTSFCVLALATFYVLLVPQLGGAVFHDHHLLWFATLLAASPAGDALSVDAWIDRRRGRPRPAGGRAHGATIHVAWLLIAAIFFFPGIHKLKESGLAWITSDNLRHQMWWKWAQDPALVPHLRIDHHPGLSKAAAAMTVLFELGFPVLVFVGLRTRLALVAAALVFHQATAYFMGIHFGVLYACYVVFVPWETLGRRLRLGRRRSAAAITTDTNANANVTADAAAADTRASWRVGVVGTLLLLGVAVAGARGAMQAYPFACYPTFQWIAASSMPGLVIELVHDDGTAETLDRSVWREPGPRGWALEWRLAGVYDHVDARRLDAFFRDAAARPPLAAHVVRTRRVRFFRVAIAVDPARRGAETSRTLIHVLDMPAR